MAPVAPSAALNEVAELSAEFRQMGPEGPYARAKEGLRLPPLMAEGFSTPPTRAMKEIAFLGKLPEVERRLSGPAPDPPEGLGRWAR